MTDSFQYAGELDHHRRLVTDVCVVGSGPAGFAFAARMAEVAPNTRVLVVEGGPAEVVEQLLVRRGDPRHLGRAYESDRVGGQEPYAGIVRGWMETCKPEYLSAHRLRSLGGTSKIWSGWWVPLHPSDLAPFPHRPDAGWPLEWSDLEPCYDWVTQAFGLPNLTDWPATADEYRPATPLSWRSFLAKRTDIAAEFRRLLSRSAATSVLLDATVTALHVDRDASGATGPAAVLVRSADGTQREIEAATVVLAAGTVENTRLLLAHDLGGPAVGRGFVEHPYVWHALQVTVPPAVRRRYPLAFGVEPVELGGGVRGFAALAFDASDGEDAPSFGSYRALLGGSPDVEGWVSLAWEQEPVDDNRIELAGSDVGRVLLTARPTIVDRATGRAAVEHVAAALTGLGCAVGELPRPVADPWCWPAPARVTPGNHPSGTTRMSRESATGVANSDCRVWGTSNLYLTGSGLFPRTGYANPTMTVCALAARLADHLGSISR